MPPQVFTQPPELVGHRGLGRGIVEGHVGNTMGSFVAAIDSGLRWVEVDVRRTLDDELFVLHDAAFPDGSLLSEMTTVQAVGRGALCLHDLLDALPQDAGVLFDIKSSMEDATRPAAATTAASLARAGQRRLGQRPIAALSFDPAALRHMRQVVPGMALGLLTWFSFPIGLAVAAAAHLDVQLLAVHAGSLWPNAATAPLDIPSLHRVVDQVHQSERQFMVWCPTVDETKSLVAAGVDALVVDDVPDQILALAGRSLVEPTPADMQSAYPLGGPT